MNAKISKSILIGRVKPWHGNPFPGAPVKKSYARADPNIAIKGQQSASDRLVQIRGRLDPYVGALDGAIGHNGLSEIYDVGPRSKGFPIHGDPRRRLAEADRAGLGLKDPEVIIMESNIHLFTLR